MGFKACFDHDVDYREEDGCPVCNCVKEIADLNVLLDLAEAALFSINNFCLDPKHLLFAGQKITKATEVSGETLAALKAGRKMIEVKR